MSASRLTSQKPLDRHDRGTRTAPDTRTWASFPAEHSLYTIAVHTESTFDVANASLRLQAEPDAFVRSSFCR